MHILTYRRWRGDKVRAHMENREYRHIVLRGSVEISRLTEQRDSGTMRRQLTDWGLFFPFGKFFPSAFPTFFTRITSDTFWFIGVSPLIVPSVAWISMVNVAPKTTGYCIIFDTNLSRGVAREKLFCLVIWGFLGGSGDLACGLHYIIIEK